MRRRNRYEQVLKAVSELKAFDFGRASCAVSTLLLVTAGIAFFQHQFSTPLPAKAVRMLCLQRATKLVAGLHAVVIDSAAMNSWMHDGIACC